MEVIKNSKETFVRLQQLIWNGGTDTHTDRQTHTQTDPCIELRYAQLKKIEDPCKFLDSQALLCYPWNHKYN